MLNDRHPHVIAARKLIAEYLDLVALDNLSPEQLARVRDLTRRLNRLGAPAVARLVLVPSTPNPTHDPKATPR